MFDLAVVCLITPKTGGSGQSNQRTTVRVNLEVIGRSGVYRVQARPLKRWSNDFEDFMVQYGLDGSWEQLAKNEEEWAKYESCFVKWASDQC